MSNTTRPESLNSKLRRFGLNAMDLQHWGSRLSDPTLRKLCLARLKGLPLQQAADQAGIDPMEAPTSEEQAFSLIAQAKLEGGGKTFQEEPAGEASEDGIPEEMMAQLAETLSRLLGVSRFRRMRQPEGPAQVMKQFMEDMRSQAIGATMARLEKEGKLPEPGSGGMIVPIDVGVAPERMEALCQEAAGAPPEREMSIEADDGSMTFHFRAGQLAELGKAMRELEAHRTAEAATDGAGSWPKSKALKA